MRFRRAAASAAPESRPPAPATRAAVPDTLAARRRGIAYALIATALFTCFDTISKLVTVELAIPMVAWGRYLVHFLLFGLLFLRYPAGALVRTKRPGLQLLRACMLVGSAVAFLFGIRVLPLAEANAIGFVSPLFVTMLAIPILGEKVGVHRWGAVIAGLVGALIIVRPGGDALAWAALFPVGSALSYAGYQVLTRILARYDDALVSTFYSGLGGLVLTSLAVPFFWQTPTLGQALVVVVLGAIGAGSHFILIKAFELAPASLLSPFSYSKMLWAIAAGYLVFDQWPDPWTLVGSAVIIASGIYTGYRETVRRRMRET